MVEHGASLHQPGTRPPPCPGAPAIGCLSTPYLWAWLWLQVGLRLWCLVCALVAVVLGVVESGVAL